MAKKNVIKSARTRPINGRGKDNRKGKNNTKNSKTAENTGVMAKLDKVLSVEKRLLDEEKKIFQKEEKLEKEEEFLRREEARTFREEQKENSRIEKIENAVEAENQKIKNTEKELSEIERLELDIKKEVGEHPLTQVKMNDIVKGLVGSFVGLVVHYSFVYGIEITSHLSVTRAAVLYILTFFVGLLFLYFTGFRKVKDPKILIFMPVRLLVLYLASLVMSVVVLFLFYPEHGHTVLDVYTSVSGLMIAAVIGACTADLIGKE